MHLENLFTKKIPIIKKNGKKKNMQSTADKIAARNYKYFPEPMLPIRKEDSLNSIEINRKKNLSELCPRGKVEKNKTHSGGIFPIVIAVYKKIWGISSWLQKPFCTRQRQKQVFKALKRQTF